MESMSVKRVMGTETEYAVSLSGAGRYNPVQLSFDVVNSAADSHSKNIRWDYRQEDPVNDARGTRLERAAARPDMLTDAPQLNITNVIAPNGGRRSLRILSGIGREGGAVLDLLQDFAGIGFGLRLAVRSGREEDFTNVIFLRALRRI